MTGVISLAALWALFLVRMKTAMVYLRELDFQVTATLLRKGKKNSVGVTAKTASRFLRQLLGADGVHERWHGTIQGVGDGPEQFSLALGEWLEVAQPEKLRR